MSPPWNKRLAAARQRQGLTQRQVAKKLGVSQALVSKWEAGSQKPNDQAREKAERILDIRLGKWKVTGDEERQTPSADAALALSVWLRKAREKQELSVVELAERAAVSSPAIYNIEAGRIRNPQKSTIVRLERALNEKLPQELREESADEEGVQGLGSLEGFDPHDQALLPDASGVYVLYDISERPVYVGRSKDIARRIREHQEKFWFKRPIVETASYIMVKDEKLRRQLEQTLIKFLKSNAVVNQQFVDRDE